MKIDSRGEFFLDSPSSHSALTRPIYSGAFRADDKIELAAYREALDNVAIVAVTDRIGRIVDVNRLFCAISGYDREELVGANHRILNSGHHPRHFFEAMWRDISAGLVWRGEICNRSKCGQLYWVDTTIAPLRNSEGAPAGYLSVRVDISSRKAAEVEIMEKVRKLSATESLLSDIVETIPSGLVVHDTNGDLLFCNDAYRRLYADSSPPQAEEATRAHPKAATAAAEAAKGGAILPLPSKPYIQQLDSSKWVQIHDRRSNSGNLVSVRTDISALKRAQLQIKQQAERDPLTGIGNRTLVMRRLSALTRSRRSNDEGAMLMLIDLDDFKLVNDRFGHDGGDTLLQEFAQRICSNVRRNDTVARLGGDEFAILMRGVDRRNADAIAEKILSVTRRPVHVGHQQVTPSASIGVALFPQDGETPAELIKSADLALYQAKLEGRRRYSFYDSSIAHRRKRRAELGSQLERAIECGDIEVAFQPKMSVSSGRHTGFEALVRWTHDGEQIPAPELISIAEEVGLINAVSFQVMDKALKALAAFKEQSPMPGTMAFNVAAAQLQDADFADRLCDLVRHHGLHPRDVEIEVTENVMLDRSAAEFSRILNALRESGVSVSLDDFGTGYAALTHLKQFPVDYLKIDKSFVAGLPDNREDEAIVRAIISLAHSLNLKVVAEGVETRDQYWSLSNFGCDEIQGHLLARPMNAMDAAAFLRSMSIPLLLS